MFWQKFFVKPIFCIGFFLGHPCPNYRKFEWYAFRIMLDNLFRPLKLQRGGGSQSLGDTEISSITPSLL